MNLRYQETFCITLLLFSSIIAEDFDFVREVKDDVKPLAAEPLGVDSRTKLIHQKALDQCLPSENRITLSLVLRSKNWNQIEHSVKQRTISTLSKYFLVPEESFNVLNIKSNDLRHMLEKAIKHGKKPDLTKKTLGIVQFKVGCGDTVFKSVKDTIRKLNTYLADINDLTEVEFTSWILLKHAVPSGPQRSKRETTDDDYDYDYDDEDEDDDEGETTEVPHAHRHHHGSSEVINGHSEQHRLAGGGLIGSVVDKRKPSTTPEAPLPSPKHKHNHGLYVQVKERLAKQQHIHGTTTTETGSADQPAERFTPLPDIRESVSQLESTISKTIRNNEQLKKEEEVLLAKKAKHKLIDIERIVETELLLPELERLQDDVFQDDYVIEDNVAKVPNVYDVTSTVENAVLPATDKPLVNELHKDYNTTSDHHIRTGNQHNNHKSSKAKSHYTGCDNHHFDSVCRHCSTDHSSILAGRLSLDKLFDIDQRKDRSDDRSHNSHRF
ncbi:hypothetical protein AND_010622 [Anopheles darlingi]|uniref:Uncharacterized protein n=1 Tax=Anopheles darlingi TaxID=43151 RepID=W5J0Y1_ANODA|nr:hypothetical protein AND_010622 [Anopheles darlingi]